MNKPVVLHFHRRFFARTETFIYHYISHLQRFQPLCCSWRYINLSQFPIEEDKLVHPQECHCWLNKISYKLLSRFTTFNFLPLRFLKEIPVRLIHAHFGPQGVFALRLKARFKVPLCTTFYGYDVSQRARQRKWVRLYERLFREGDLFLVEGNYMKECLMKLGCPGNKIQIQRIAIPLEKIVCRSRKPKGRDEKVRVFFSGTLVEKKGLVYALKAIELVKRKNKDFEFCIIGDGPLRCTIRRFIRDHKLGSVVRWYGYLPYAEYLRAMNDADIFLHPSVTAKDGDSEGGAPTVILEAQAMGIPVISSYHADIPNVVVPGQSALLSAERDVEGIAANLLLLLEDQSLWAKMGQAGRDFVQTRHDIKKEVVLLEDKYAGLLN